MSDSGVPNLEALCDSRPVWWLPMARMCTLHDDVTKSIGYGAYRRFGVFRVGQNWPSALVLQAARTRKACVLVSKVLQPWTGPLMTLRFSSILPAWMGVAGKWTLLGRACALYSYSLHSSLIDFSGFGLLLSDLRAN